MEGVRGSLGTRYRWRASVQAAAVFSSAVVVYFRGGRGRRISSNDASVPVHWTTGLNALFSEALHHFSWTVGIQRGVQLVSIQTQAEVCFRWLFTVHHLTIASFLINIPYLFAVHIFTTS